MELAAFRSALDDWLDTHAAELAPADADPTSLEGHLEQLAKGKNLAFDAGFMRWGWPERIGGLGGSSILRAYLGEALTARVVGKSRFSRFDDDTWVYPGHGDDTTLGAERPHLAEWKQRGW